jgi:hypothetical protein
VSCAVRPALFPASDNVDPVREAGARSHDMRRIELYRRYMHESVDASLIFDYLREIVAAEDELAELLQSDTGPKHPRSIVQF